MILNLYLSVISDKILVILKSNNIITYNLPQKVPPKLKNPFPFPFRGKCPKDDRGWDLGGFTIMLLNERETRRERLLKVAEAMATAARTAPKGKGIDIIEILTVTDEHIAELSAEMIRYSEKSGLKFFIRDAENLQHAEAVVLIGTKIKNHGLNCGYCGFPTCVEKDEHPEIPCALNAVDVGIAIGSACATATDMRVDSRVMFSAGRAAQDLGWMPGCSNIYAIPISCSSKNPFFDRKSTRPNG